MLRGRKLGLDNFLDREELGSILDVKSTFCREVGKGCGRGGLILLDGLLSRVALQRLMTVSSKSDKCLANIAFYVIFRTPVASAKISPIGACYTCLPVIGGKC